jgi:hypothetical protein
MRPCAGQINETGRVDTATRPRSGRLQGLPRDQGIRLADCLALRTRPLRVRPEPVGERPPDVAKIGPAGDSLELPVDAHEGAEIGLEALFLLLLEHPEVPGAWVDPELRREQERTVAEVGRRCLG